MQPATVWQRAWHSASDSVVIDWRSFPGRSVSLSKHALLRMYVDAHVQLNTDPDHDVYLDGSHCPDPASASVITTLGKAKKVPLTATETMFHSSDVPARSTT